MTLASATAADGVGIPLDPLSSLPWEVAAPGVCGDTIDVDGARKVVRWWVRDADGRLDRIVTRLHGSSLLREKRYLYDPQGRLRRVERWETQDGRLVLDQYREYVRGDDGRLVSIRWFVPDHGNNDSYQENTEVTVDAAGRLGGRETQRDAQGRLVQVRNGATPLFTVEYAPDGLSATETFADGLVARWTFDASGVPVTTTASAHGGETEVSTWHRDCTAFPPMPVEPGP